MRTRDEHELGSVTVRTVAALLVLAAAWMPPEVSLAQTATGTEGGDAWSAERAYRETERLRTEIGVLRGLARAQAALEAWNRVRTESGAGPAALGAHLCEEPELGSWCLALPATFGGGAAAGAGNPHSGDTRAGDTRAGDPRAGDAER